MLKGLLALTLIVATFAKLDLLDILEEALAERQEQSVSRQGEKGIYFQNNLNGPIYANYDCDRQTVKEETSEWSVELGVEAKKVSGNVGVTNKETKEYMTSFMDRSGKFTKVQPGSFLKEAAGLGCTTIYATVWAIDSKGQVSSFMNASGMHQGQLLKLTGSVDAPKYEKTFSVCGGDKCGCWKNHCWSYCSFGKQWCYTGKSYSQSFKYEACTKDEQCMPSWKCAGSCTV